MQDEGAVNSPQILWIRRDDMQIAFSCADSNRDIDNIGVARPAAEEALACAAL
jgi:hypothetical protein